MPQTAIREIKLLMKLEHPSLVKLKEVVVSEQIPRSKGERLSARLTPPSPGPSTYSLTPPPPLVWATAAAAYSCVLLLRAASTCSRRLSGHPAGWRR